MFIYALTLQKIENNLQNMLHYRLALIAYKIFNTWWRHQMETFSA